MKDISKANNIYDSLMALKNLGVKDSMLVNFLGDDCKYVKPYLHINRNAFKEIFEPIEVESEDYAADGVNMVVSADYKGVEFRCFFTVEEYQEYVFGVDYEEN